MKNIRRIRAFTLVELVIVIVVVAILSIVAIPIYRSYVTKSLFTEAKTLMSSVEKGELIWASTYNTFLEVDPGTSYEPDLDIDIRSNKYFTSFEVNISGDGSSATAITQGVDVAQNLSLTLIFDELRKRPRWKENVIQ